MPVGKRRRRDGSEQTAKRARLSTQDSSKRENSNKNQMSPFETPHPSILTQAQIFKLPSSKPQHSGAPLSPVPVPVLTSSGKLKENQNRSAPWGEPSSRTLHSSHIKHARRSASISSSNSSSASSNHQHKHDPGKGLTKHKKKPLKSNMKPKRSKRTLPLASPFVSRASSPTLFPTLDPAAGAGGAGTMPPPTLVPRKLKGAGLKRGLSDTFYNPNLPSPHPQNRRSMEGGRKEKVYAQSTHTSPSFRAAEPAAAVVGRGMSMDAILGSRSGSKSKHHITEVGRGVRERRPSAPSSFHTKAKPKAPQGNATQKPLPSGLDVNLAGPQHSPRPLLLLRNGAPRLHHAQPALQPATHADVRPPIAINDIEHEMSWTRGADFNRPPSQMTFHAWEAAEVFSSSSNSSSNSSSSNSSSDEGHPHQHPHQRQNRAHQGIPVDFGFELNAGMFGDDAWGVSTPLHLQFLPNFSIGAGGAQQEQEETVRRSSSSADLRHSSSSATGMADRGRGRGMGRGRDREGGRKGKEGVARVRSLPSLGGASGGVSVAGIIARRETGDPVRARRSGEDEDEGEGGLRSCWSSPSSEEEEEEEGEVVERSAGGARGMWDAQEDREEGEDQEEEAGEDMDLTDPLTATLTAVGAAANANANLSRGWGLGEERSAWVTDSLISPPTGYLREKDVDQGDDEQHGDNGEQRSRTSSSSDTASPFLRAFSPAPSAKPTTSTSTTTRTRSGTIVPVRPPTKTTEKAQDPPGTRRTRSGTLLGPLPLPPPPAGPSTSKPHGVSVGGPSAPARRARSGTILAVPPSLPSLSDGKALGSALGAGGGVRRTRSGTVVGPGVGPALSTQGRFEEEEEEDDVDDEECRGTQASADAVGMGVGEEEETEEDLDVDAEVECYQDALYEPRVGSSPDPIDFLRFKHNYNHPRNTQSQKWSVAEGAEEVEEADEAEEVDLDAWCVADEPPSPVVQRKARLALNSGSGNGNGLANGIMNKKGKKRQAGTLKAIARFAGLEEEEEEDEEVGVGGAGGGGGAGEGLGEGLGEGQEMSEDELLLGPGSTRDIWV
ncbi:hypothetical protein B0H34DRAFT_797049 [Crassisporium funariophilum]|nr:hypothetical protein B0H34DRAFT_797049 [Crassisporium funariophilum]